MATRVKADEMTIKLSLEENYRYKLFRIPMNLLMQFVKHNGVKDYNLTHEAAGHILKAMYSNCPDDIYVNWMNIEPGRAVINVVATSKTFESLTDGLPVPPFEGLFQVITDSRMPSDEVAFVNDKGQDVGRIVNLSKPEDGTDDKKTENA